MNNENYISEEAFEELVNGLEFIERFTLYGRKSLKYHIKRLQEENQQLKGSLQTYEILLKANVEENQQLREELQQKEDIINKIRELIDELYLTNDDKCYDIYKNILNILDNKGE